VDNYRVFPGPVIVESLKNETNNLEKMVSYENSGIKSYWTRIIFQNFYIKIYWTRIICFKTFVSKVIKQE
jgi:hypothetical protein